MVGQEENISREELLKRIRQAVSEAAARLSTMGPEYARVGWMLEDTMMYLDELQGAEVALPHHPLCSESSEEQKEEAQAGGN